MLSKSLENSLSYGIFYKFCKKARVYYTLSISRGGTQAPGFATVIVTDVLKTGIMPACTLNMRVKLNSASPNYYIKVLEKCTKNLIGHSRLAFNNHESNIDC